MRKYNTVFNKLKSRNNKKSKYIDAFSKKNYDSLIKKLNKSK